MPAAWAAAWAFSRERLAMARSSAFSAWAKAGSKRWLIFAAPRIPQRTFVVVAMLRTPGPRCGTVRRPCHNRGLWHGLLTVPPARPQVSLRSPARPNSLYNGLRWLTTDHESRTTDNLMCLVAVLFRVVEDAPLVVGANREEHYDRPGEPPRLLDG